METMKDLVDEISLMLCRYEDPETEAKLASEAACEIINHILSWERKRAGAVGDFPMAPKRWADFFDWPDGGSIKGVPLEAK